MSTEHRRPSESLSRLKKWLAELAERKANARLTEYYGDHPPEHPRYAHRPRPKFSFPPKDPKRPS